MPIVKATRLSCRFTVDASVVLARLLDESRPSWVDAVFVDVRDGRASLHAPMLLWLEIGNRLVRTRAVTDAFALEAMLRAESLPIATVEIGRPLRLRALQLGRAHALTMYDATYLAAAEATSASLLTLDAELERAATGLGLGREGGPRRASEPAARYGDTQGDRTSLAAIGAAIAEMRRQDPA